MWGGWFQKINCSDKITIQDSFSEKQKLLPINTKEFLAILFTFTAFQSHICHQNILIHCDNVTAISCIKHKGSKQPLRDKITQKLFNLIHNSDAHVQITYINTKDNITADRLSRQVLRNEATEWEISCESFELIKCLCHIKLDIDLFASTLNKKLKRFAAWAGDAGAEITGAFTATWCSFIPFLNPPFSLWKTETGQHKTGSRPGPTAPQPTMVCKFSENVSSGSNSHAKKHCKTDETSVGQNKNTPHGKKSKVYFSTFIREVLNRYSKLPSHVSQQIAEKTWRIPPKRLMIRLLTNGSNSVISKARIRTTSNLTP